MPVRMDGKYGVYYSDLFHLKCMYSMHLILLYLQLCMYMKNLYVKSKVR